MRLSVLKSQNIYRGSHTRYLRISWLKISLLSGQIKNGVDFTYLFLKNGKVRYNCSILDLYDRSIIASITDRHITSELAIRTLQKALDSQAMRKENSFFIAIRRYSLHRKHSLSIVILSM